MVRKDWSRPYINAQVDRLRRMFRWAASEELLPASLYESLRTVAGLRAGKTEARDTEKVKPVPHETVQTTLPYLPAVVQTMVQFQLLTGCRPAEVCSLRPLDLDMSNPSCWIYRPASDRGPHGKHKTSHHGHDRLILVGPRAQEVLRPYLGTKMDGCCFCPTVALAERNATRRATRQTPLYPSHLKRNAAKQRRHPRRAPGDRYDTHSYRRAIKRACEQAFPLPDHLAPRQQGNEKDSQRAWWSRLTAEQRAQVRAWRRNHSWHPNQLRHTRATEIRKHYGLEAAQVILGHSRADVTQVYAERNHSLAERIATEIG